MGFFTTILNQHKQRKQQLVYAKMMKGVTPVFNDFGTDIYASDIVQNCVRRVCKEMAKLHPRHVTVNKDGMIFTKYGSDINRLWKKKPNPLMTTSDFLSRITYQREVKKNVYILPTWEEIPVKGNSNKYVRRYTGFWPLNPSHVEFKTDTSGIVYICFRFEAEPGQEYIYPYADIIHWRKDYTESDFFGGGPNGEPHTQAMLNQLEADNYATQAISKGVQSSNSVYGIIKQNTMLDDGTLAEKQKEFEEKVKQNTSGFLVLDLKNDFQQVNMSPQILASDVSKQVMQRILSGWSMSIDVYNGDFDEGKYQAWYEAYLEDLIISLGQAFTSTLFTDREIDVGNEVIFYDEGLQYMNNRNKIDTVTLLTNIGFLTDNQVGAVFGYPPFEGGNVRKQSLNYIDREIASAYQMANAGKGKTNDQTSEDKDS